MYGELRELFATGQVLEGEPMKKHTTFRVGGPADLFVVPGSGRELADGLIWLERKGIPHFILGAGSNVVFDDAGYRGVVISMRSLNTCTLSGEFLSADAGVAMAAFSQKAMQNALTGAEFLSGVPGTMGGGVRMNAGCYGAEIANICESVTVLRHGRPKVFHRENLAFSYRENGFLESGDVILSAKFHLSAGNRNEIAHRMRELASCRRLKQPLDLPSAGSAFRRPEKGYAAAYIDGAGLKGYRVGDAAVSTKHAGFVVNLGNAKSGEIRKLIDYIRKEVYNKYSVVLQPEIIFVRP